MATCDPGCVPSFMQCATAAISGIVALAWTAYQEWRHYKEKKEKEVSVVVHP